MRWPNVNHLSDDAMWSWFTRNSTTVHARKKSLGCWEHSLACGLHYHYSDGGLAWRLLIQIFGFDRTAILAVITSDGVNHCCIAKSYDSLIIRRHHSSRFHGGAKPKKLVSGALSLLSRLKSPINLVYQPWSIDNPAPNRQISRSWPIFYSRPIV